MKKIAMFTMGTRGDIQPYVYLAQELIENGCDVLIGSHPCWRELIQSAGVNYVPVGPDIDIEKEAAVIRGRVRNPALSMLKTMNFVFKIIRNSSEDVYQAAKGRDLIVVSHSQMGATEAEALGIPTVNVTLQTEMIPRAAKKERLTDKLIARQIAKPYNKIRRRYGLKPARDIGKIMSEKLDLIPISTFVKPRDPHWEAQHVMTGFWYRETENYQPDEALRTFLESGEKPILLALGAMAFEDKAETEKLKAFIGAFEKCGARAVIQGFQKALREVVLPETMFAAAAVPHDYLFRKCRIVVHHCGFGTAAAALLYGVPSIPAPHVLDQIGFAQTLFELGVAARPLDGNRIAEAQVIERIQDMEAHYEERLRAARDLSVKLKEEHGLQKAVELILGIA